MADRVEGRIVVPCGECNGMGEYDDIATGRTVCHQCDGAGEMLHPKGDSECPSTPS